MSRFFMWGAALFVGGLLLLVAVTVGQPIFNRYAQTPTSDQQTAILPVALQDEKPMPTLLATVDIAPIRTSKPVVEIVAPAGSIDQSTHELDDVALTEMVGLADPASVTRRDENIRADSAGQMGDSRIVARGVLLQATASPLSVVATQAISTTATVTQTNVPVSTSTPDMRLTAAEIVHAVASVAPIQERGTSTATPEPFIVPLPTKSTLITQSVVAPTSIVHPNATQTITDTVLYAGPSNDSAILRTIASATVLAIVGRHTTGNWYLLADGAWIAINVVKNPPQQLPLVFATVTPTPTSSPTVTPTDTPIPPTVEPPTLTPTPTSLEAPICACQSDQYECLGSYFPSQAEAQQCFEYCFRQTGMDVHNLDPNLNGRACENLE